jgi:lipoate-protein ligase A
VTEALLSDVRETGEAAVRTWTPGRQVAFGRRDVRTEGHERARATARDRGFPPVERRVGGRAVAFADATVAVLRADPVAGVRRGIAARYGRALDALDGALSELDAAVVVVDEAETIAGVLESVYAALGVPLDREPVVERVA